jgi:uncharacterized membrane protein
MDNLAMYRRTKPFKIAVVATLVALSIATNYVLIGIHNIKLMDFIVFVGGFCFGSIAGASIGVLSWLIYGVLNPYGFVPQVWLATMLAEPVYGIVGGILGKNLGLINFHEQRLRLSIFFATMGFLPTVLYDLITNVAYASSFDIPVIAAFFSGAPFIVLHEISNAAIFGMCSVPMITALEKLSGGERI